MKEEPPRGGLGDLWHNPQRRCRHGRLCTRAHPKHGGGIVNNAIPGSADLKGFERHTANEVLYPLEAGALGQPVPILDAVSSMLRKGFALPGTRPHVMQENKGGRCGFQKLTPAERKILGSDLGQRGRRCSGR